MIRLTSVTVASFVALVSANPALAQTAPLLDVTLKPGAADGQGHVAYVDVITKVPAADAPAGAPLLALPVVVANVEGVAKTLTRLEVLDAGGPVPLTVQDQGAGSPVEVRQWIPSRAVVGDLTVSYRAPTDNSPPIRGSGPPFGLRTEGGGLSGAGSIFLMQPVTAKPYRLAVRWDLAAMGKGATGTSSFGDGDVELPAGSPARLGSAFFMAGPLHRHPTQLRASGFSSAWLDGAPADTAQVMAWTEKLHAWYDVNFKGGGELPYRVFLRYNPVNPGGGVALTNSFVATYDAKTTGESMKLTLAHEMLHTWAPTLGAHSSQTSNTQWFGEGIAVYYARLLPWRAGLLGPDAFLEDLNETAGRYYSNALIDTPNDQIAGRFWEETRVRVLPYDRGSMYMAVVDEKIRKASGGKRSLDHVMQTLIDHKRAGVETTQETWLELVSAELGPVAETDFEAMLGGAVQLPGPGAFGPCFTRSTTTLRQFELGFDGKSLVQPVRIVQGVVPGSAAEQAGLRNGDEILKPVGLDSVQSDQKRTVTWQVRRDGKTFEITYLPRGKSVEVPQWKRVEGVSDAACKF